MEKPFSRGRIDFQDKKIDYLLLIFKSKPIILVVNLIIASASDLTEFEKVSKALIADFDVSSDIIFELIYGEFNPKGKILDTLVYVRKLWPDIKVSDLNNANIPESLKGRHSLDAWGYRLGENKGSYEKGWDTFTDEMLKYCIQDVKVTSILWKLISSKL